MAEDFTVGLAGLRNMAPREVLEESSNSRIDPNSIAITPYVPHKCGGQSEIVLGFTVSSPNPEPTNGSVCLAVKKFKFDGGEDSSYKVFGGFAHEVGLLRRLSHQNIIKPRGFVEDESKNVAWLVFSWEQNGNLREFIASAEWEIPECISLMQDVANGVAYLHTREPPICHGGLKPENILVNATYQAVITDFGFAQVQEPGAFISEVAGPEVENEESSESFDDDNGSLNVEFCPTSGTLVLTGAASSLRWAAPEVLADDERSLPSDIWALGWIFWEVMTKAVPFAHIQHMNSTVSHVVTGKLPTIQETQTSQILTLCNLMMNCWKQKPNKRPYAVQCQGDLHWMPSTCPSPAMRGNHGKVRSATLLIKLGEMHWAQDNIEGAEASYEAALDLARKIQDSKLIGTGLLGLAEVFRRQSRVSEAESYTAEALQLFSRNEDEWGMARCYLGLARLRYLHSKNPEAEQFFLQALEIYTRVQDVMGAVVTLEGLSEVCQAQLKLSEAVKYLSQGLEIYKSVGNEMGRGNSLIRLANIYRVLAKYQEADLLFLEALNVFTRIGSVGGRGNALVGLASVRSVQSNPSEAEPFFIEAIGIYEQLGDYVGESCALNGLGELYRSQSRYSEAEATFSHASDICTRIGNELEKGKALLGLGKTYRVQSKFAVAQGAFTRAREAFKLIGDDMGRANALNGLGEVSLAYFQYSEADALFSEALVVSHSLDYDLGRGNALLGLGHSNRARKMYPAAEAFFIRALEVYTRTGNVIGKAHSLNELGRTYLAQNKCSEAESCLSEAMECFRQCGQEILTAGLLISLGHISMTTGDLGTADERWTEAKRIFSRMGHTDGEIQAEKCLSHIWKMRNQSRGSYFRLLAVLACLAVAWAAWSAVQRESWLYSLRSRFPLIAA